MQNPWASKCKNGIKLYINIKVPYEWCDHTCIRDNDHQMGFKNIQTIDFINSCLFYGNIFMFYLFVMLITILRVFIRSKDISNLYNKKSLVFII
jgi:hypothetical protein